MRGAISSVQASRAACSRPRRSRFAKRSHSRIRATRVEAASRSAVTLAFARPAPQPFREARPLPHSRDLRRSRFAKRSHSRIRATRAAAVSRSAATPVFARPALKPFREAQLLPSSRVPRRSRLAKRSYFRILATCVEAIPRSAATPAFARHARFCIRMSSAAKAPSRTAFKGYSGEERLSACSRAAKRASSQSRGEHILAKSTDSRRET